MKPAPRQNIQLVASRRDLSWTPADRQHRIFYSDCGSFAVSERDLTPRVQPSEFDHLNERRARFAKTHPDLFRKQPSIDAAREALDRACRLLRSQAVSVAQPAAPVAKRDVLVPMPTGKSGKRFAQLYARRFGVDVVRQGDVLLTSRKGCAVLEEILAMKSSRFTDLEIWDELERRHGWVKHA
jgi:hypothetical protein